MKRTIILLTAAIIECFVCSAQTNQKQLPGKPSEQKEIKADKHLEKQLQQKQLSEKPESLNEQILPKAADDKKSTIKTVNSRKGRNIKPKKS